MKKILIIIIVLIVLFIGYSITVTPSYKTLDISHASPAPEVSAQSFGHGGFTGTYVWADPVNNLMFIFLSNRVYPTRNNRNLYNLNIRPSLQQVFYQANLN